jgi:hypothetical protein
MSKHSISVKVELVYKCNEEVTFEEWRMAIGNNILNIFDESSMTDDPMTIDKLIIEEA